MLKTIVNVYKIPLLLSITLAVTLIALRVERNSLTIAFIILGSLLGTVILDLDYIIYAYFLEPNHDFSKTLKTFIHHKDYSNTLAFIHFHKNDLQDKILNSALFQGVLAGAAIFVMASNTGFFIKALVLSTFVNSIYRLIEEHLENRTETWFWALKTKPNKIMLYTYTAVLIGILLYCLSTV